MNRAFVVSTALKPMAKQLLDMRSSVAYSGVEVYARRHAKDEAGALANLVLGYAHLLDHDYASALAKLKKTQAVKESLGDYIAYLTAMADAGAGNPAQVVSVLHDFDNVYPDSIFTRDAAQLYANALLTSERPQEAIAVLLNHRNPPRADMELVLGGAYLKLGERDRAIDALGRVYYAMPLSQEAEAAGAELAAAGAMPGTFDQRRMRADLLAQGRRYQDALRDYRALLPEATVPEVRERIELATAQAQYRSGDKSGGRQALESLSLSSPALNAQRLAALADLARSDGDEDRFLKALADLRQAAPSSSSLEQSLLSAGNMYLLKRDNDRAIDFYREVYERFPQGRSAHYAHWKVAWLGYRQGRNEEASKLFDEQIALYADSPEIPATLYWRARLAEDAGEKARARAYYEKITDRFPNFYYADRARERLKAIPASGMEVEDALLDRVPPVRFPAHLPAGPPEDDLRVRKALLLENASLFDFAVRELQQAASEGGQLWAAAEIARLYQESGGYHLALETLKHAVPSYWSMDYTALPREYWEMLFPRPYWTDLKRYSLKYGLDPFLVASLIRQESEFNPGAVSRANALGLMQLLPGTGRKLAKELRMRGFSSNHLLVPSTNLQLGTRYFRHLLDEFDGKLEYALAAYNAGSDRVQDWLAQGKFRDPQEFVESIPFTETREYVQAILRNATVYRKIYHNP